MRLWSIDGIPNKYLIRIDSKESSFSIEMERPTQWRWALNSLSIDTPYISLQKFLKEYFETATIQFMPGISGTTTGSVYSGYVTNTAAYRYDVENTATTAFTV